MLHLIGNNIIPCLRPEYLKRLHIPRTDIFSLIGGKLRMLSIRRFHKCGIRFNSQNPSNHIRGNIIFIDSGCTPRLFLNRTVPMNEVYQILHILIQILQKLRVKCICRLTQPILVIPGSLKQVKRLVCTLIIFIKRFIKSRRLHSINADAICVHFPYLRKPSGIFLMRNRGLSGIIPRFPQSKIDTLYIERGKRSPIIGA